ncbi:uncharacterized protein [Rutidosis leptorrhynchoides]|uniref:uncharacterized protein n=1 Tax=Rutidosis leptorrhynchoides TaxID=125765 RepID=UPI003A9A5D40
MDVLPTPFPGNKAHSVKSKYNKIAEPPKQKTKETCVQMQRRTFGTIRNPNIPEKAVPQKQKTRPSDKVSSKVPKTKPEPKAESTNKTPQNGMKKKTVTFSGKSEGSEKEKTPAMEVDGVNTPVRPPFSVKPVRIPGTPYFTAEKCSNCQFDRLETASYWLGQIKSAESVGKHFVSVAFFRLANHCKAEPVRNLQIELKKYLARHDYLSSKIEWEDVSHLYGILKKDGEAKNNEEYKDDHCDTKLAGISDVQELNTEKDDDDDWVKEIYEET